MLAEKHTMDSISVHFWPHAQSKVARSIIPFEMLSDELCPHSCIKIPRPYPGGNRIPSFSLRVFQKQLRKKTRFNLYD